MNEKIITRHVPVKLTDAEKLHRSSAMVGLMEDGDKINAEFAAIKLTFKARLESNANDINKHRRALETGEELREVEVEIASDIGLGMWVYSYQGKQVDLVPMTPKEIHEETNPPLPLEPESPATSDEERPWISLEDERPDVHAVVETGEFDEDTETVVDLLLTGSIYPVRDIAFAVANDPHTLPTDPSEPKTEEWNVTHWRPLAPATEEDKPATFGYSSSAASALVDPLEDSEDDNGGDE